MKRGSDASLGVVLDQGGTGLTSLLGCSVTRAIVHDKYINGGNAFNVLGYASNDALYGGFFVQRRQGDQETKPSLRHRKLTSAKACASALCEIYLRNNHENPPDTWLYLGANNSEQLDKSRDYSMRLHMSK